MRQSLLTLLILLPSMLTSLSACQQEVSSRDVSDTKATPPARQLLGLAVDYDAESDLDSTQLSGSVAARRALAWRIVTKVLAPSQLTGASDRKSIPAWLTYYDREDLRRLFQKLYADHGVAARANRTALLPSTIDAALNWNTTMVGSLPSWPQDRYERWVSQILDSDQATSATRANSLAGLSRTLYSTASTLQILGNYAEIYNCEKSQDLGESDPIPQQLGQSEENFSLCFGTEFPKNSVVIKTSWRRTDFGMQVPSYDTSADRLKTLLSSPVSEWGEGQRLVSPGDSQIFTMRNDSGATFRLTGLHIMTKELREWVWISLWWSDTPQSDFGQDRPESIKSLGEPWSNYKMCVVTAYDDHEDLSASALVAAYPSLGAALIATQDTAGSRSWCSNPYFERGARNHRSNCIGCHQQAGTRATNEQILAGDAGSSFPDSGRQRIRENFPTDYLWSVNKDPEHLGDLFQKEIEHYDIYDRF